ncbi:MAG: type II toxin-antitoxin system RelE/ParE family toxin [Bryobacteraceae bacterium]
MNWPQFVLTPEARADLIEIWNYIAEDSIDSADQVVARLYDAFARLGQAPKVGHHREDLADSRHRFWSVYSYVIAYRWETTPVQIIAIVHGARQLEAFFQQRIT